MTLALTREPGPGATTPTLPILAAGRPRLRRVLPVWSPAGARPRIALASPHEGRSGRGRGRPGQGVQTFEIEATRAGRRIEVTTARGVVEVTEVTRGGTPVRTGRFMASRLIALVEHPAHEWTAPGSMSRPGAGCAAPHGTQAYRRT